jgi:CheY-like chemotaxis protein
MPKQMPIVLLISNKADDANIIRDVLTAQYAETALEVVPDGTTALDYLFSTGRYAQRGTRLLPQLILVDVQTPTAKTLAALHVLSFYLRTRNIPIAVLVRSPEDRNSLEQQPLNIKDYIEAPENQKQFRKLIQRQMSLWLADIRAARKTGSHPGASDSQTNRAVR